MCFIFTYYDLTCVLKKKKKLNKVSFYFPVIYSARILGERIFFSLLSLPLSVFASAELCVRSVGRL